MLVFFIFIFYLYSETDSDMPGQLVNKTQIGEQKNEATFLFVHNGSVGLPKLICE